MRRLSCLPYHRLFHPRTAHVPVVLVVLVALFLSGAAASRAAEGTSDRTFATALYGQAVRLTSIEDYSKAITLLTRAVEVDPQFSEGVRLRGKLSLLMRSAEETIQQRTKEIAAARKGSAPVVALRERGAALYRVGRYGEAAADFSAVIEQEPNDATAYYQRGLAFVALKDGLHALADYAAYRRLQQASAAARAERQAELL